MKKYNHINRGWTVAFAGMGVNLALGVLYSWGAFQTVLTQEPYNWSALQSQIPYMIACFIFATLMVPSGRIQDKAGPKLVVKLSWIATLLGFVLSGYFISPFGLSFSFGIIFGLAMSMGYSALTPAALKWFPAKKWGQVSGIVVGGFWLAGIYIAPLVKYLLSQYSLSETFIILGFFYGIIILVLAQFISNPPKNYKPDKEKNVSKITANTQNYNWKQVLRTKQFYGLWSMFGIGTLAGLLIIGQLRSIWLEQASLSTNLAFWLISIYALFNWTWRIWCGVITDKIGTKLTLFIMFVLQMLTFSLFSTFTTAISIFIGTAIVAFTFGGMLTIFPKITADYFGIKNLGVNYGLVFTAWWFGGVFGPLLGGIVRDITGTYNFAYMVSAILSVVAIFIVFSINPPKTAQYFEKE